MKPIVGAFESQQFGLLPNGDDHYAVAFLHSITSASLPWQ
jgi:hypothetical protein